MSDSLKLSVYFGESDRVGGALLSDALVDVFERRALHASILLRAVEGFGLEQTLRTDRFLTLSEDLPLVALAVDERSRVEAALAEVEPLVPGGIVTLERARLLHDGLAAGAPAEPTKLTLYLGRDEPFLSVVDHLHRQGLSGATVFLGVDGTAHRQRRRARFLSRNDRVPLMVVSVGDGASVGAALPGLARLLRDPIATLERVRVCKRDGVLLDEPPPGDAWQKLTVYASEQARHEGHPLHTRLIRRLREEGAPGATSLRGVWGFSGDHPPHGDRLFRVRRHVPVVTTIVDRADATRRWFAVVDEVTDEAGLVTCETVPALLGVGAGSRVGDLRLR